MSWVWNPLTCYLFKSIYNQRTTIFTSTTKDVLKGQFGVFQKAVLRHLWEYCLKDFNHISMQVQYTETNRWRLHDLMTITFSTFANTNTLFYFQQSRFNWKTKWRLCAAIFPLFHVCNWSYVPVLQTCVKFLNCIIIRR